MQKYEIMAIIANSVKETEAENIAKKSVTERITSLGGKITFEDFWGARGFAYKIEKQAWGYYLVLQFEADGQKLAEFKRDLNLDKDVVRFLISKVDKNAPAPKTYADMRKEDEAMAREKNGEEDVKEEKKDVVAEKKLDKIVKDSSADL